MKTLLALLLTTIAFSAHAEISPTKFCELQDGVMVCNEAPRADSAAHGHIDGTDAATVAAGSLKIQRGWVEDLLEWLKGAFLFVPQWVYQELTDALISSVSGIGALLGPVFNTDRNSDITSSVPRTVMWVAALFEFDFGLTIMMASLLARFVLRRIPLIG